MPEKIILNFEELKQKSYDLADKVKSSGEKFDMIVTLTKGGLIPTYFVADKLGIKIIETLNINSYTKEGSQAEIIDRTIFSKSFKDKKILIVDDLVDSGNTLSYVLEKYEIGEYKIATIYYKKKSKIIPDFYCENANDEWIIFPYES